MPIVLKRCGDAQWMPTLGSRPGATGGLSGKKARVPLQPPETGAHKAKADGLDAGQ